MASHFFQNGVVRRAILAMYHPWARMQFHRSGPRVLINSLPKSGTHLLTSEFAKIKRMMNSRIHFDTADIVSGGQEARPFELTAGGFNVDVVERKISQVRPGQFLTSHIAYTPEVADILEQLDIRVVNLVRDPRDIMVSNFHYLKGLRRHRIHEFFVGLEDDHARYAAILRGHESSPRIVPYATILAEFAGWVEDPRILTVCFEDLVGDRGGGSDGVKKRVLVQVCEHIGLEGSGPTEADVALGTTSVTFRKGKIGGWRDELTPEIKALFDQLCGSAIRRLGYGQEGETPTRNTTE